MAGWAGFVGRNRELSRLRGALVGDTRLLLVVGDAGVGKTRFAGEGMRRAAAQGTVLLWAGCLPLAEKLPLLPVVEAVGALGKLDGGLLEAGLDAAPPYVRVEVERLLPQLGPGEAGTGGPGAGWRRERLFAAVAELLGAVARRHPVGLVIEDVHWADSETLDCLTFLTRAHRGSGVTVVATCRSDEAPLDPLVADWLAHVRGGGQTEEIRLPPLSRDEVAEQIAGLAGEHPPPAFVEELYARGEGNPFFTEQLVDAALAESGEGAGSGEGVLSSPGVLPARLAELLVARVERCGGEARAVLAALVVAGRPLSEALLCDITALEVDVVRRGLRELAAARLLAASTPAGTQRPRHALLAEAVAAELLPGEQVLLHERTARALETTAGAALAAETAGHWAAAGRGGEELAARIAAAEAAERLFGYAEAAAQWQRAIELCDTRQGEDATAGIDVPRLYVRAMDALEASGNGKGAGELSEEAFRRFAGHPESATAAIIHLRAAFYRGMDAPTAGLPLIKEALRLFGQAPPSADHAEAWLRYSGVFLLHAEGRQEASLPALNRALEIAEQAGATALIPRILSVLAVHTFVRGQVEEGFAIVERARALAGTSHDGEATLWLAASESDALLQTGKFQRAAGVALQGLEAARRAGRETSFHANLLAAYASDALLARGRTAEAAALIDPLTTGPPDRDHHLVHECRAEIDLLRGDVDAATSRMRQVSAVIGHGSSVLFAREAARRAAELALWAGRTGGAVEQVRRVLALFKAPDMTVFCGRLLTVGMRACADMSERARARGDEHALQAALAAAGDLTSWADHMAGAPFTDHPYAATVAGERATWDAERTRLAGESDPGAWNVAAKTWEDLGCPHRAAYTRWRQSQALLASGQPPAETAATLRSAAAAAEGHAPLLERIRALAQRARVPLQAPQAAAPDAPPQVPTPYGLTERELAVLRLLATGRTNAQIGAELFISPKTASVHVTSILRKLGVATRVQAAGLAERAGLLRSGAP